MFAEILLLNRLDSSKNGSGVKLSDVILVPGKSCYPFTDAPDKNQKSGGVEVIRSDDQLIKILHLLGPQKPEDYAFLQEQGSKEYLELIQRSVKFRTDRLDSKFKDFGEDFVDLLKGMLHFNPEKRMTAK